MFQAMYVTATAALLSPFYLLAMTAREYTFYKALAELPGEGVIAMEFVKP